MQDHSRNVENEAYCRRAGCPGCDLCIATTLTKPRKACNTIGHWQVSSEFLSLTESIPGFEFWKTSKLAISHLDTTSMCHEHNHYSYTGRGLNAQLELNFLLIDILSGFGFFNRTTRSLWFGRSRELPLPSYLYRTYTTNHLGVTVWFTQFRTLT